MPSLPRTFLQLDTEQSRYETSRAAVWPVPYERTTSYGKGTAHGPAALLEASAQVETWDEELAGEPCRMGIATLPPFLPEAFALERALEEIRAEARRHLEAGKFLLTLGGEHGLTLGPARAAAEVAGGAARLGVVQFDAHADLRREYEGTPYSHACVMRRLVEDGHPTLALGLRALSQPEASFIEERRLPVIWGRELESAQERFPALLEALPEHVYLTFDVDFFDPSLLPATGTPEPGGGTWYPTLRLLRALFRRKTVVAMDVVELAPRAGHHASDYTAARLACKCLAYLWEKEGRR